MLTTNGQTVGIILQVLAFIPFGDMFNILVSGGRKATTLSVHGLTCLVMLFAGLLLIYAFQVTPINKRTNQTLTAKHMSPTLWESGFDSAVLAADTRRHTPRPCETSKRAMASEFLQRCRMHWRSSSAGFAVTNLSPWWGFTEVFRDAEKFCDADL